MKKVECLIKPLKLEGARDALSTLGITGGKFSEVRGFGRRRGQTELYRGAECRIDFIPKVKIELAVPAEQVAEMVEAVRRKPPSVLSATARFLSVISNGPFESGPAKTGPKAP